MPFQHRATITLHGNLTDPEIPIYGAKVKISYDTIAFFLFSHIPQKWPI